MSTLSRRLESKEPDFDPDFDVSDMKLDISDSDASKQLKLLVVCAAKYDFFFDLFMEVNIMLKCSFVN